VQRLQRTNTALVEAAERRLDSAAGVSAFTQLESMLALRRLVEGRTRELEAAEHLLHSIFDSLEGRMCIIAADGRLLGSNALWNETFPAAGVQLGVQRGPGAARAGPEASTPVNLFQVLERFPAALGRQIVDAIETVIEGRSGHCEAQGEWDPPSGTEYVVVRVHRVREHDQARAVVVMVDISESLKTRERLRHVTEQAHLLALVATYMDKSIFILDSQGEIEWVNDAFTRTTGYSRADLAGVASHQLAAVLVGGLDLGEVGDRPPPGPSEHLGHQALRKDGTPYWIELEMQSLLQPGRPPRMIGVLRDITQRRHAQQQISASQLQAEELAAELSTEKVLLAKVLRSIPHLVYWKDSTLRYAGVNDAFLRLRDCARAEEVLGLTELELACQDALRGVLPPVESQVLATGESVDNVPLTVTPADGVLHRLLLSVLPQTDEEGRVTGVIGVAADVTQLSDLERQLAQATRLESIGQLAAGVAHEINTPVQFVSDNVRFVADCFAQILPALQRLTAAGGTEPAGGADPELSRLLGNLDLDFILEEVPGAMAQSLEGLSRVAEIVRAMKDFSHPGGERTATDLNRAIDSTLQVSRNEWKYVAECDVCLDPEVGFVWCFEGEIKQALLNLIVNAAHAIAEHRQRNHLAGLGRLAVSSRRERDTVIIEVGDNGSGMTDQVRARIFDPFFTTKDVGKGTGQGLSMVHATIVKKHGGSIEVDSRPDEGARFVITLPAPRSELIKPGP
jgi:PAS domain S-box-containing protein